MSVHIPPTLPQDPLTQPLCDAGLTLTHRGKVRSTYAIPNHPDLVLSVASNGISIFDFVLNAIVPYKGEVLTAMTVFWLTEVLQLVSNHLVACGRSIDQYLPTALWNSCALRKRALVIKKLEMLPIECIVRGYLTGSGWASYQKDGSVCGISLAANLYDGARILPGPIFTPTTKAETGHDEHLSEISVIEKYGQWVSDRSIHCYTKMASVAQNRGIIIADTKFEFGSNGMLADEVGTPDSSRFWDFSAWSVANDSRVSPPSRDKEQVRTWGKSVALPASLRLNAEHGINNLDPANPVHLEFLDHLVIPNEITDKTSRIYLSVFHQLTRTTLNQFQIQIMGA